VNPFPLLKMHFETEFHTFRPKEKEIQNSTKKTCIAQLTQKKLKPIKHHLQSSYKQDFLQATSLSVEDSIGPLTISSVYLPLKTRFNFPK
jgi:hypothetical protein